MANTAQARKRVRQANKSALHNYSIRSDARTAMKKVLKSLAQSNRDAAMAAFKVTQVKIDKMISKGILSKNAGARIKSRLNKRLKAAA